MRNVMISFLFEIKHALNLSLGSPLLYYFFVYFLLGVSLKQVDLHSKSVRIQLRH